MPEVILNSDHISQALERAIGRCQSRLWIATADVKDLHLPRPGKRSVSIVHAFGELASRGVRVRVLHGGVPSGPFLEELKQGIPETLSMRRCPRMHVKAVVADGLGMYLGSANLTGAGLGAKSEKRRNFEAGIWTEDVALIDPVLDMLNSVWEGQACESCGRKEHCPVPLEEPDLG